MSAVDRFRLFLKKNGLGDEVYNHAAPLKRFIRLRPSCDHSNVLASLEGEITREGGRGGSSPCIEALPWLPGFYSLPAEVNIAGTTAYKQGDAYGIEASSGAAVHVLDPQAGEAVLVRILYRRWQMPELLDVAE
jgi:16S rRNA C967 or C1407 C5-methylase (RsmB/RsmF family)